MNYLIISNGKWRTWVFRAEDKERAEKFAKWFHLPEPKPVREIPFCAGYTVYA